jgi:lysophospholipase L1-like esterase
MTIRPHLLFKDAAITPTPLRIMPVGDSITYGLGSTTLNGYRQPLLQLLPSRRIEYIGSQKSGTMKNPENEGYGGAIISEIANASLPTLAQHPNLVLLMAGVNDINRETDIPGAPRRLAKLVEGIFEKCAEAVVVVAQLTPFPDRQAEVDELNAGIARFVNEMIAWGRHVVMVRMEECLTSPKEHLADGLHPNDAGYEKMAECWVKGIESAETNGWIVKPADI